MPHVTISSTMDFNVAKIASSAHHHDIVDEIVTCGIAFKAYLQRSFLLKTIINTPELNKYIPLVHSGSKLISL